MSVSSTGTKGEPVFDSTGNTPTFAADLTAAAAYAAKVGNRVVGTTSERTGYATPYEGLEWHDTTTKLVYRHDGTSWIVVGSMTVPCFSVSGTQSGVAAGTVTTLTQVDSSDFTAVGFTVASGVWTVPLDGVYDIGYWMQPNGTSATGYVDSQVTKGGTSTVISKDSASGNASGFPASHRRKLVNLSAGDNIRLRVLQNTGASRDVAYEFSAMWVGAKLL